MTFLSTLLVFFICIVSSFFWTVLQFTGSIFFPSFKQMKSLKATLSSLIMAPLVFMAAYQFLGVQVLYPIILDSSWCQLFLASLLPAWVLMVCSGLLSSLSQNVRLELSRWESAVFTTVGVCYGQSRFKILWSLVVVRVFLQSWITVFPWFFGEMVVVEAMFNIPGVGMRLWHHMRQYDFHGMSKYMLFLGGAYGVVYFLFFGLQRRFGRLLQTYA